MESLVNALSRGMGRPVLDQTGLHGEYMVPRDFNSLVMRGSLGRYLEVSDAKRLRTLEEENRRLKEMVADLSLDREALKTVIRKNGWSL